MLDAHSLIRRLTATVGLAAALLTSATLFGPVAAADPAPGGGVAVPGIPYSAGSARPLEVQVHGTYATVRLTSAEPALFSLTLTSVQGTTRSIPATSTPKTDHTLTLSDLRSNTAYTLEVKATAKGQTLNHAASFTTLKQRVRLVLDKIVVHDDGDWIGKGEPTWFWSMTWDKVLDGGVTVVNGETTGWCYPYGAICEVGSTGEGTLYPTNRNGEKLTLTFAEENFRVLPERFRLGASADESDLLGLLCSPPCEFQPANVETLQVPKYAESSSLVIKINAHGDHLRSTMYFRFETFHDTLAYPPNMGSTSVHINK